MKRLALLAALGIGSVSFSVGQEPAAQPANASPGAQTGDSKAGKSGSSNSKVTTDDTVFNPDDKTNNAKNKGASGKSGDKRDKGDTKNNAKPVSPPNPPVVDPHEDPTSPVNTPKAGNLPTQGPK
jgi:hypothetical protein